jgi:quinol monooxygenase YgiN
MSKKVLALMTGVLLMTTPPAIANDYPPFIPAPAEATPVLVIVELVAKDPNALERYLSSAQVIPTTRLASGINYSWTVHDRNNPNRFLLIQQWNSVAQQQGYIAWRNKRGNLAQLRTFLSEDPVVTYLNPIDMMALPSQAR